MIKIKAFKNSLTLRIFRITVQLLTVVCFLTYAFIALAMPVSYNGKITSDKKQAFYELTNELEHQPLAEWGPMVDRFILDNEVNLTLRDPDGNSVKIPGQSISMAVNGNNSVIVTTTVESSSLFEGTALVQDVLTEGKMEIQSEDGISWSIAVDSAVNDQGKGLWERLCSRWMRFWGNFGVINSSKFGTIHGIMWELPITPAGETGVYSLIASSAYVPINQAVEAIERILPWLAAAILCMSVAGALIYSRYITKPIVALNGVSQKMAALDFSWKCDEKRTDEIGDLARSFNLLSGRLSTALEQLQEANRTLQDDIDRERELEQQRMMFFSAVSHELKTPITIIKGQIEGMLGNIGTYRDRDKYLARALETACRMEGMVQELLTVSRMETSAEIQKQDIRLDELVQEQVSHFLDLSEQKNISIQVKAEEDIRVYGDRRLLKRAFDNLLSNALTYSPKGERIFIAVGKKGDKPVLMVENTGTNIPEDSLPHLFEPFYRVEQSRNRRTGGSGLGLYLVRMILERHVAVCTVENTPSGVLATVLFGEG